MKYNISKVLYLLPNLGEIMSNKVAKKLLDKEWEELILDALKIGISVEEIRNFLNEYSRPK
jgi:hypothetical protein